MNAYLNYLIEANLGLLVSVLFYELFLRKETQFSFKRAYLLLGISASLVFPLITIQTASAIPSIGQVMPTYFLPELVIGDKQTSAMEISGFSFWTAIKWTYILISIGLLIIFVARISRIVAYLKKANARLYGKRFRIIESTSNMPTFSFFHYIFIGNSAAFSAEEKEQIVNHEITHASKLHSLDILLIELLKIMFWFNPVVYYFKSLFTSIHEFQADQLAVDKQDVNQYCDLLARVALQSADYPIANHFNNSLTLKRIDMMKTAKTKLSRWKIATIAPLLIGLFVFIACQDQVMNDIKDITSASTMVDEGNYTPNVKKLVTKLQTENPSKSYFVMEVTRGDEDKKLEKLESEYKGLTRAGVVEPGSGRHFVIFERGERTQQLSNFTKTEGEVFTIVEESATPVGGIPEFYKLIGEKMKYPLEARTKGLEGKVFIEFIINTDGTLSDIRPVKGIGEICDQEAVRVVSLSPPWLPGKQNGIAVRQRMVLPITFKLEGSGKKIEVGQTDQPTLSELVVSGYAPKKN